MKAIILALLAASVISTSLISRSDKQPISKRGAEIANASSAMLEATQRGKNRQPLPKLVELLKIAESNPTNGDVQYYCAAGLLSSKRYDEAIAAYDKVLELGAVTPKLTAACKYDQACAYALSGRNEQAMTTLKASMAAGFRDIAHLRSDSDLNSLHSHKDWEELAATKDTSKMSRVEGWTYDLWYLNRELRRIHYKFDCQHSAAEWDQQVKTIKQNIPHWPDEKVQMEMKKLTAMAGDGHTSLAVFGQTPAYYAPIKFDECFDGPMVTGAMTGYEKWFGWRLKSLGGLPYESFKRRFAEYISKDNAMGTIKMIPRFATNSSFLFGANLIHDKKFIDLELENSTNGDVVSLKLPCAPGTPDYKSPIKDLSAVRSLKNRSKFYWYEVIPNTKTIYFQYNSILVDPQESVDAFTTRLGDYIANNDVDRLIIDLRLNGGGNNQTYRGLLRMLIRSRVNEFARLYVIVGRNTFSAAQCFATEVERDTDAIFVGEPSGSRPNFVGETIQFELPYSKVRGSISDLYWQKGQAFDNRMWISPQIPALNTYAEFAAGEDVAIDAILARPVPVHK